MLFERLTAPELAMPGNLGQLGGNFGGNRRNPNWSCPQTPQHRAKRQARCKNHPHLRPRGLYLEVSPRGGKWWRLKYRYVGKEKRVSLGVYPEVNLKRAGARTIEARQLLDAGVDPNRA